MADPNSLERLPKRCLIIGAGPAGTATGILLSQQGWRVTLVDRRSRIEQKICGECLSPPSRGLLKKLGVWDRIAADDIGELIGITLVGAQGGKCFLDFGNEHPFTISRPILDQALLDEAIRVGVEVHLGVTVTQILKNDSSDDSDYEYRVEGNSGKFKAAANFLVGADGRHSLVAKQLNLAKRQKHRLKHAAVMSHFSQPNERVFGVEMHVAPWGYVGINPLPQNQVNVIAVLSPALLKEKLSGKGHSGLLSFLSSHVSGSDAPKTLRKRMEGAHLITDRAWTVSSMTWLPRRLIGQHCALIGDSAGFVDPFTGEGLYHALASADYLCSQIQNPSAIQNQTFQEALIQYENWHQKKFGPEEDFCFWLQKLLPFSRVSDYVIRQLGRKPHLSHILAESVADRLPTRKVLSPWFWGKVLWPN